TLRSHDYFGQFGRINKIVINRRQNGSGGSSTTSNPQHPSVGVYVTYATKEEATRAINAVDGSLLDGRVLRATFGTTKYCSYYLRSIPCQNPGCMYLHEPGEEADSFTKEDLAANRAELRDVPREAFDHDDDYPAGRAINQSPNTHQAGGRATASAAVSVSSLPGFQNNRPQSAVTTAAAAVPHAQLSMAATNAATRLRKASELSALRPRSVEPHTTDGDGGSGSALPATASWAARAMSKKATNEPPEPKPRRSDTGGTMTLRMIPASRNKAAGASTIATKPSGAAAAPAVAVAVPGSSISPTMLSASSVSTRDRAKTATVTTAAATSDAAVTPASGAGIQHHPTLQQLSRERKHQQRHQTRAQQKQARQVDAEDIDGDGDTETDIDIDSETDRKRKLAASKAASKASAIVAAGASAVSASASNAPVGKPSQPQLEEIEPVSAAAATTVQEVDTTDAEVPAPASISDAVPEQPVIEPSTEPTQQPLTVVPATAEYDQSDIGAPEGYVLQTESQEQSTAGYDAIQAGNHTSSALSFQSITDSLFAQLNAKVSTPPTNNMPAFSGAGGSGSAAVFDGHVGGVRNPAGYPVSSVDPLLFPPMGMDGNDVSSAGYGRMDSAPQFSVFGGQPNAQWGRLGMMPGGYAPASLSSVLAGPPALGPPSMGSLGEAPSSTGRLGAFSRQRSRWDFVHADEASAQAELQSVLGRGPGDKNAHHQQQQQHGPPAGSFMSSRDLGMFSTPIQNDYGRQWGGGGQQGDGYAVPHPPPGFGGRQRSDLMRATESSALPMLGSGTPPGGVIGGGSNTLLSRLMGQTSSGLDVSGASGESGLPASHYPMSQSQQYHGYQDPAILSSYAAPPVSMNSMQAMASNASMGNMQQAAIQQQQARGRGDPNVLSSLLARLHLGQGEGSSPLAAMGSQAGPASMSFMSQPMVHRGSIGSGGMAPPGIEPMGVAGSPVYNSTLGQARMQQQQQPQMAMGRNVMPLGLNTSAGGSGFADPAIMHMGRVNVGSGPTSPVGLPPGILSPQSADSAGGYVGQMQPTMVSRSANSSGRSRFLNHFSPDGVPSNAPQQQQQQQQQIQSGGGIENNAQSPVDEKSESEVETGNNGNMVNGVPPGLPTTGLFGELLRRAKLEAVAAVSAGNATAATAPLPTSGSTYVSGKMMLSDIERKLDAARREARDLQAQLSTVIGQNQSAMWALANGSTSPSGGMDKATGFGFSAAGSV
ncbi:transcriptional repressor general negative regulator of transcription subunit 4, partial [Coemansia sp. S100]